MSTLNLAHGIHQHGTGPIELVIVERNPELSKGWVALVENPHIASNNGIAWHRTWLTPSTITSQPGGIKRKEYAITQPGVYEADSVAGKDAAHRLLFEITETGGYRILADSALGHTIAIAVARRFQLNPIGIRAETNAP